MATKDFGGIWKILGTQGNQMVPQSMMQMAAQAEPDPSVPPFLRAQNAYQPLPPEQVEPPPPPMPTPVSGGNQPYSVQPTTSPPGSVPQELVPSQPTVAESSSQSMTAPMQQALDRYNEAYANFKLPPNGQMLKQFATSEKNYAGQQAAHQMEIDKLKEGLAKYQSSQPGINFTPLAALSDAWYGGNLTAAAQAGAPETAAARAKNIAAMQEAITREQGQIPKEELDMMKTKLAQMGYMDERALKAEVAKLNAAAKVAGTATTQTTAGKRIEMMDKRLNLQVDKEARSTVNNDSVLKQFVPRLEGAAKIGELIGAARKGEVVSNQALLGQLNAEIARLETGSQSPGLHASEKTELLDAAAEISAIRDRITGQPSDAVRPEVMDAADKLVKELSGSYMKGIDSRMDSLRAGMTPEQQKIVDAKHESLKATYTPRFGGWYGIGAAHGAHGAGPVAPKVGEVVDGHVFLGGDPSKPESWRAQ